MGVFLGGLVGVYVLHRRGDLAARGWWTPVAAALIVLALIFTITPEARALLMLVDYLGIDLVVTVTLLFLREHLAITLVLLFLPLLRIAYRWGPVPGFWPDRTVLRSSMMWTGYAVICPVLVAAVAAMWLIVLGCLMRQLLV